MRPIEKALQKAREIADRFKHRHSIDNFTIDMALLIDDGYRDGVEDTIKKCIEAIRKDCVACNGTGHIDDCVSECEYCGRPIASIRALPPVGKPEVDDGTV